MLGGAQKLLGHSSVDMTADVKEWKPASFAASRLARLDNYPGRAEVVGEVVEKRGKLV